MFVNPDDMVELGLVDRQLVDLISEWTDRERVVESFIAVPFGLPRRCAATYFPEANALVPLDSIADRSRTPTSKSVVIRSGPDRTTSHCASVDRAMISSPSGPAKSVHSPHRASRRAIRIG